MANRSSTYGVIQFKHPNAKSNLIERIIEYTKEHFYFGELNCENDTQTTNKTIWKWNKKYVFESSGRWSFYSTLKNFFENFQDAPFKHELDRLTLTVNYIDYEPGVQYFVKECVVIKALLLDNGQLETREQKHETTDISYCAENLIGYQIADLAFDTFTEYGIEQYVAYVTNYMKDNPNEFEDLPKLKHLAMKLQHIPIIDLYTVFSEECIHVVTDHDENPDDYYIKHILYKQNGTYHPLIEPYTHA